MSNLVSFTAVDVEFARDVMLALVAERYRDKVPELNTVTFVDVMLVLEDAAERLRETDGVHTPDPNDPIDRRMAEVVQEIRDIGKQVADEACPETERCPRT